jgi:hypothetical protein
MMFGGTSRADVRCLAIRREGAGASVLAFVLAASINLATIASSRAEGLPEALAKAYQTNPLALRVLRLRCGRALGRPTCGHALCCVGAPNLQTCRRALCFIYAPILQTCLALRWGSQPW